MNFTLDRLVIRLRKFREDYWNTRDTRKLNEEEKFKERLKIFDFMRGLAMTLLVLASFHGIDKYAKGQFSFKATAGVTFIDYSLPFFLMTLGAVIPLAISDRMERFKKKNAIYKIITRSVSLAILGLTLSILLSLLEGSRFIGSLQVLAIIYFLTGFLYYILKFNKIKETAIGGLFLILAFLVIVVHIVLMSSMGYQVSQALRYVDSTSALRALVGTKYINITIMGFLSALASTFLGVFIGSVHLVKDHNKKTYIDENGKKSSITVKKNGWQRLKPDIRKFIKLMVLSLGLFSLYFFLRGRVPVMLTYWSGSFVILSGAVYSLIAGLGFFILDILRLDRPFIFFIALGANSTLVYVILVLIKVYMGLTTKASIYLAKEMPLDQFITYDYLLYSFGQNKASLIFSLLILLFVTVISYLLYSFRKLLRL